MLCFDSKHKEERERLPQQLRELQDTLTLLTRECEEKKNQIEELQLEHELMRTAVRIFSCSQCISTVLRVM